MSEQAPVHSTGSRLIFPNVLEEGIAAINAKCDGSDNTETISNIFFELANSTEILYRIRNKERNSDNGPGFLVFQQDVDACSRHTGGIIWETSYLLLEYLIEQQQLQKIVSKKNFFLGNTLELGAGVGFLGQCLVAESLSSTLTTMILTETSDVLTNLQRNLHRNQAMKIKSNINKPAISVYELDWTTYENNILESGDGIRPHSIDTLLGTDVIFTKSLVDPLLRTAEYLSHNDTIWYLCVQIRCAQAHEYFLRQAIHYGFYIHDISDECFSLSSCAWGKELDCYVFRITRK